MLRHWCSTSLSLLIAGLLSSEAVSAKDFENTAIVRQVDLAGSLVQATTTYAVKALRDGADVYTVALSTQDKERTSWMEARLKGQQKALVWHARPLDTPKTDYHFVDIKLPKRLGLNETLNIVLDTVQTHATKPWPEQSAQKDEQALIYKTGLYVISPYRTLVQRTKLKSPSPRIISHTELEDISFATGAPFTKSGSTVTYGPFNNIPPSSNEAFLEKHQDEVLIHFHYDHPVLEVLKLRRAVEVSHWGANLNIQDDIHLRNAGPKLKGHFSRLDHQAQAFYKKPAPHVLPSLTLHLPPGIRNTYYYDLIGNVSTSRLRAAPRLPRGSNAKLSSVLELRPRYPLLGGWNYTFTLGWDAPLGDSASYDSKTGKYYVKVPIMTVIPGAVVDEAEVKVTLPEGADDFEFTPPFPAKSMWISTEKTYLDTSGRPTLTFEYNDLTAKHDGYIYVSYRVPISAHFQKPVAVSAAFMGLFVLAIFWRRIDLRIHKTKKA
ncbi:hypothetical protein HGRIS_009994 [Hohenbuehelia grisea]|uniref:Dolichyl-diphosphooligosaccharide--protein glycosyltransferase subunit 1 n=1 Tax=Hohenbuehelia grisea TaxID=104357 RepID=A0ABR3J3E5_9AGAR